MRTIVDNGWPLSLSGRVQQLVLEPKILELSRPALEKIKMRELWKITLGRSEYDTKKFGVVAVGSAKS